MMRPSTKGPLSLTLQLAVPPVDRLVMVTIVPNGSVRWAHVPGGAAWYQVAPPVWELPLGAGAEEDDGFGADLEVGAGAVERAGERVVGGVRRTAVVVVGRDAVLARNGVRTAGALVVGGDVVGGSVVGGSGWLTSAAAERGGASPARSETRRPERARAAVAVLGGGPAAARAATGTPAMARHKTMGTRRRVFLDPREVRGTPPFCKTPGPPALASS